MKRLAATILILFFCSKTAVCQTEEGVSSTIKAVTLFPYQALVSREASLKVGKGPQKVLLDVQAFNVDKDSVSAAVFGDGEVVGVQLKDKYLTEMPQPAIRELEKKLEELKDSRKALERARTVSAKKEEFLDGIVKFSQVQVPQEMKTSFPKPEDLTNTLTFLGTNFTQVYKEKDGLDIQLREMDKEIERVANELEAVRGPADKAKKVIEIIFDSRKEQEIRIDASYLVSYAGWEPLYRADVPEGLGTIGLTMFASCGQTTGEDWKNVRLTLSNVAPLMGGGLPDPGMWGISIVPKAPPPSRSREMAMYKAKAVVADYATADSEAGGIGGAEEYPVKEEASYAVAGRAETPLSFEYLLPQALDILSREEHSILPVITKNIKGEYFHFSAPQISSLVFLVCRAQSDRELLSGMLNIYFGGRFVGKVTLDEKKPGEPFDIPLGADRQVTVKREKVLDKKDETFIGKIERMTVIRTMVFKITAENAKDKPATLLLIDSVPVSSTDKVVVKDVKFSIPPSEKDHLGREGVMLWKIALGPRETKELTVEFTVTYPKDETIAGL